MSDSTISTLVPRSVAAKARRVDFISKPSDHACALYAALGFSTRFIQRETALSPHQISYRIRKAGLTQANGASRLDFRNGTSPFAQNLLNLAKQRTDRELVRFLKRNTA